MGRVAGPALLAEPGTSAGRLAYVAVRQLEAEGTDEALAKIRNFYSQFTDNGGGTQVNLQGIVFGTNQGGRLPVERYIEATVRDRAALASGTKTIAAVAK